MAVTIGLSVLVQFTEVEQGQVCCPECSLKVGVKYLAGRGIVSVAVPQSGDADAEGVLIGDNVQAAPAQPRYLISSTTASKGSLLHERLHALYHLSEPYASAVHTHYTTQLSRKARKIIEHDLQLRGYRASVWEDEWQAYLLGSSVGDKEGPGEATWGKGPREECMECKSALVDIARAEANKWGICIAL